jgi:hypothetical protein
MTTFTLSVNWYPLLALPLLFFTIAVAYIVDKVFSSHQTQHVYHPQHDTRSFEDLESRGAMPNTPSKSKFRNNIFGLKNRRNFVAERDPASEKQYPPVKPELKEPAIFEYNHQIMIAALAQKLSTLAASQESPLDNITVSDIELPQREPSKLAGLALRHGLSRPPVEGWSGGSLDSDHTRLSVPDYGSRETKKPKKSRIARKDPLERSTPFYAVKQHIAGKAYSFT